MTCGVALYSYTIGNLTNIIGSMDHSSEEISEKIDILKRFRSRTGLPYETFLKIKRHFENN